MARLSGKNGSVYFGAGAGTIVGDTHNWEFEEMQEVAPCSIKGEAFERYAADHGNARVRVECYLQGLSHLSSVMQADMVAAISGAGTVVTFNLYALESDHTTTARVVGTGYLIRSQLRVNHDGLITDELEIQVDTLTTVT